MIKKLFIKTLAILNLSEGVIHIVTASISFWGMFSLGVWDWRVATSPTADIFLGFVSIVTGVVLNKWGCQHHHHCEDKNVGVKDVGVQEVAGSK